MLINVTYKQGVKKMKEIEDLGLGTANVAAITTTVISNAIQEVARGERVYAQFFKVNTDILGNGKPHEMSFPKKGTGVSASWDVSEGTSIAPSSFAYESTTIRVKKAGVRLEFNNEALESAMRDVIADHIYEAGQIYGELMDDVAKTVMLDLTSSAFTITTGSVGTFSSAPMVSIVPAVATLVSAEYDTGVMTISGSVAAATITVTYCAGSIEGSTLFVGAAAPTTITAKDILLGRAKLIAQNRHPNVCIMNDEDIPGFLYDSNVKWLDAWTYRGAGPLLNAEVGQLFGLRVVTTTRAPVGVVAVIDTKRMGYNVKKRNLTGVREDKPEYDQVWYHYWAEENFGKTDDLSVAVVTNGQPLAT